jgi:hypothetical protein
MIDATIDYALQQGVAPDHSNFQILYGIRWNLRASLLKRGYRFSMYLLLGLE